MRDRFLPGVLAVFVALAFGVAAGWWLRGADNTREGDPKVPVNVLSGLPLSNAESQSTIEPPPQEHRERKIVARIIDHNENHDRAPVRLRPARLEALRGAVTNRLAAESPVEAEIGSEEESILRRALERKADFLEFGDGPVAHDRVAEAATSEPNTSSECLPLGAQGCRQDLDCCGTFVCRTQAGQIAGFLECTESR